MALRTFLERVVLDGLFGFPLMSAGFTGVLVCGHVHHLLEKQRAGMTCIPSCQPPLAQHALFFQRSEGLLTFVIRDVMSLATRSRIPHDDVLAARRPRV